MMVGVAPLTAQVLTLTEEGLLKRFSEENPKSRAFKASVEVVNAEMRARTLSPNPTISYSREDALGSIEDYLLVGQTLPVSGRLSLLRRAGGAAVNAQRELSSHGSLQLRSDLRLEFYNLLLAEQQESAIRQGVTDFQEVVRILREREREGEGSLYDRLRAERELAEIQAQLISTEAVAAQARARVASFLAPGTDPSSLAVSGHFDISRSLPPLVELVSRALEVRGDYKAEQEQLQRLEFERRAGERLRIPEPTLVAGLKKVQAFGMSDSGYVLGLNFSIPLFNRGQTETALARSAIERTQADRQALEQRIATEVKAAYAATQLRRRLAEEYAREVEGKDVELARIAQTAYQEGEQRILELLDAHRLNLNSKLHVLEMVAAAKLAEVELDRAVGGEVFP
jgi:cobalt-zinc-cadmium efflux system outer membrane protein